MYYRDMSYYRDGEEYDIIDIYPSIKNIGWLEKKHYFKQGDISPEIIQKLKEIIFLDLKINNDKKNQDYNSRDAINIHCMHVRGTPYKCNLCNEARIIEYEPINLKIYSGSSSMRAGLNEVCIPSLTKGEFYSFPTMLLHYITDHKYCPPQPFLDALRYFSLKKPYNIDKAQEEIEIIEVNKNELSKYN